MKLWTLILFLFLSVSLVIAEGLEGQWHGSIQPERWQSDIPVSWYEFSEEKYKIDTTVEGYSPLEQIIPYNRIIDGCYNEDGTFSTNSVDGLLYVNFKSASGFTLKNQLGALVSTRRLFLYDNNKIFFAPDENATWLGYSPKIIAVRSSSSLKEEGVAYDGGSFIQVPGGKLLPWIEGVEGDGIDEWIEFEIRSTRGWSTRELLVANGFISFTNPTLFKKNNRIRGYLITSPELTSPVEGELRDTPELQSIMLPNSLTGEIVTLRFTILSVYKGERGDDTCISLAYPLPPKPATQYGPK